MQELAVFVAESQRGGDQEILVALIGAGATILSAIGVVTAAVLTIRAANKRQTEALKQEIAAAEIRQRVALGAAAKQQKKERRAAARRLDDQLAAEANRLWTQLEAEGNRRDADALRAIIEDGAAAAETMRSACLDCLYGELAPDAFGALHEEWIGRAIQTRWRLRARLQITHPIGEAWLELDGATDSYVQKTLELAHSTGAVEFGSQLSAAADSEFEAVNDRMRDLFRVVRTQLGEHLSKGPKPENA